MKLMVDAVIVQPKLTQGEFENYVKLYHGLIIEREAARISQEDYILRRTELQNEFFDKNNSGDMVTFRSVEQLRAFFQRLVSPNTLNDIVEHELSHGRKAEALGHSVQYGTFLMMGYSGDIVAVPFTHVIDEASVNIFREISNAPKDPSVYDKL